MDDAALVGKIQRLGHFGGDGQSFLHGQQVIFGRVFGEALSFHVFHSHVGKPFLLAHIENGDNVGMGELPRSLSFLVKSFLQALDLLGFVEPVKADGLDGHQTVDDRIAALKNHPHSSLTQFAQDFIPANFLDRAAGLQTNRLIGLCWLSGSRGKNSSVSHLGNRFFLRRRCPQGSG